MWHEESHWRRCQEGETSYLSNASKRHRSDYLICRKKSPWWKVEARHHTVVDAKLTVGLRIGKNL